MRDLSTRLPSVHIHHGFKPATPVEEAFARAKRLALPDEPLGYDVIGPLPLPDRVPDPVIRVDGNLYANAMCAWRIVTDGKKAPSGVYSFLRSRNLPHQFVDGKKLYLVSAMQAAFDHGDQRGRRRRRV